MTRVWRLTAAAYADKFFSGKGALKYGGRWNNPGKAVVYMSQTLSLSALENIVHMRKIHFLRNYKCIWADIPDQLITTLPSKKIPKNWKNSIAPIETRILGDQWFDSGVTPVLKVPSVVIDVEHNYLIKPDHPQFSDISVGNIQGFNFDHRLFEF